MFILMQEEDLDIQGPMDLVDQYQAELDAANRDALYMERRAYRTRAFQKIDVMGPEDIVLNMDTSDEEGMF